MPDLTVEKERGGSNWFFWAQKCTFNGTVRKIKEKTTIIDLGDRLRVYIPNILKGTKITVSDLCLAISDTNDL